ncbi:MAG TPA: YdeI/OmpD-associated family protein [Terriglobia bacterium]|nr:YdeI/OmpD-associated family protein [Terriglobia bacterium]
MANELMQLEVRDRQRWRRWLEKHHASSPGVWLVFHKGHNTGVKCVPYEDSVREALCFGWVDSLVKRLDDDRYARKFTPRKPSSKWSELNRKRWAELNSEGLLAPPGRAAAPTGNSYAQRPEIPELPRYIATALKGNSQAWSAFNRLAPSHRREYVRWIHSAKREETRERRVKESITLLARGQKLGLK